MKQVPKFVFRLKLEISEVFRSLDWSVSESLSSPFCVSLKVDYAMPSKAYTRFTMVSDGRSRYFTIYPFVPCHLSFVEWAQNEIAVVPDLHKRILYSDEAHFWLNGYVNKKNCRIWSEANPQVSVETPLHPEKLTVWCALWAGGILLQNDEGHNVTVNGDRYIAMITNFFIPELNNHDVQELWFQQDGATCHTARATIYLLKNTFGDRLISRFGPVNWPQDLVI
ncbi:putative transposable element [Trichonephila clavipes]|nr:putative transposable element [Trichonephila clavipes]